MFCNENRDEIRDQGVRHSRVRSDGRAWRAGIRRAHDFIYWTVESLRFGSRIAGRCPHRIRRMESAGAASPHIFSGRPRRMREIRESPDSFAQVN